MTGHVYCAKCEGLDLFKIGHTARPIERLQTLQTQSPYPMHFVIVMDVGCPERSKAFEKFAKRSLIPTHSHGEWHTDLAAIRDVFEIFAPAVDVTEECAVRPKRPGPVNLPSSLEVLDGWLAEADQKIDRRNQMRSVPTQGEAAA